jgi:hypothetical protein
MVAFVRQPLALAASAISAGVFAAAANTRHPQNVLRSGASRWSAANAQMRRMPQTGSGTTTDHRLSSRTGGCKWRNESTFAWAPRGNRAADGFSERHLQTPFSSQGILWHYRVGNCNDGWPTRTPLSTTATCQQEKTENWTEMDGHPTRTPGVFVGPRQSCFQTGESEGSKYLRNVWDTGDAPEGALSTKTARQVGATGIGSPGKIRTSNPSVHYRGFRCSGSTA